MTKQVNKSIYIVKQKKDWKGKEVGGELVECGGVGGRRRILVVGGGGKMTPHRR
jgi:hypothetical protein